ncbi:MAG: HpcH/HpaI aldolase/citrate lyase family protein, partial [Granulosicoccaceae bacterium]
MQAVKRPRRSALFVPADNQRALQKIGPSMAADCVIIDLEDAVAKAKKAEARQRLPALLSELDTGGRELLIRVNATDDADHEPDLALVANLPVDGVVLPKVEQPTQVQALAKALPDHIRLWAMIETAQGVLSAAAICQAHSKLDAMMVGTQDLALDLKLQPNTSSSQMIDHCLMQCVLAARAAGMCAIDAVCPDFKDLDPLRIQCRKAVNLGYDGKSAIHPAQLEIINQSFSPSDEELNQARAIVHAWQ